MTDPFSPYQKLADFAGVCYVENGRDAKRDGGLDCWGFYRAARARLGLAVPPPHLVTGADEIMREWEDGKRDRHWTKLDRPEPFCLVLLERPGRPLHCGIVLEDGISYAHVDARGFHFAKLDSPAERLRKKEFYRYEG